MQDFEINQCLLDLLKIQPTRSPNHQSINQDLTNLEDWQCLLDKAIDQKVAVLLYFQLQSLPDLKVPTAIQETLQAIYKKRTLFNMALMGELKSILNLFNLYDIPVIVLKGAYLAKDIYPKIGLREMVDIDLLVHPKDLNKGAEILQELGYCSNRFYETTLDIDPQFGHQLLPFYKSSSPATVEIHWTICDRDEAYQFDIAEVWQRATPIDFWGEQALVFAPTDLIIHLCHHASYHHLFEVGLRSLCDLAQIIDHFQSQLDWDKIIKTSERWQWQKGVYIMIALAHQCLEIPLPDSVLQSIQYYIPITNGKILEMSKAELLGANDISKKLYKNVMKLALESDMVKIKTVLKRIFMSPAEMSIWYPVVPSYYSPRLYFYYLVRIRDLWKNHGEIAVEILKSNEKVLSMTERKQKLNQWLMSESE